MKRTCLALIVLAAASAPAGFAENQIWTSADLQKSFGSDNRWRAELDTEWRFQPDGDLDTIELRPGIGYKLDNGMRVSGGYFYGVARRNGPDQREHRLWQQLNYDLAKIGGGKLKGRTRLEERWRESADDTGWRVRQQVTFERPLTDNLDLELSSDLFFGLNETDWNQATGFQENRAKASLIFDLGSGKEFELGYLNQFRNGTGGRANETNHHLFIGIAKAF